MNSSLTKLNQRIINCKKCPRLSEYIREVAKNKVRRYIDENYWGRPLSGFGDPNAHLLIIGLAPAAHGGNRTGRMFTGDSSGDWLAKALYQNGFATKDTSTNLNDGFSLIDAYITATVRCAPPKNKPLKEEFENCSIFLEKEFQILSKIRVILCLGKIAFDSCCKLLDIKGEKFSHGGIIQHNDFTIICSYHPSRQNTQTGRLTWTQWIRVFKIAKKLLSRLN